MVKTKLVILQSLILIFSLWFRSEVGFAMTSLDNAEEGLAIVQVKAAMWGSGILSLVEDSKIGELKLAVIAPSHLIQNETKPIVQITSRVGNFLSGFIDDTKSVVPQFKELKSSDIEATVEFQDALKDIAVLRLAISTHDPLYLPLLEIAQKNEILCKDEDSREGCFKLADFYSNMKSRLVLNQKVSWILNGKLVAQPLNTENNANSVAVVDDQDISGLYKKIFAISVYGGPGMSGGGFYFNHMLAGMVSKVHYDGYPEVYAIPMNEIYKVLSCDYWKSTKCETERPTSYWSKQGDQKFLTVNYQGIQLKQIVAPVPLGFAGSEAHEATKTPEQQQLKYFDINQQSKLKSKVEKIIVEKPNGSQRLTPLRMDGPGVVGSGGNQRNPYFYIHHLPGGEVMERTGIPLVNAFLLSENSFILNNEKYCSLKLSDRGQEIFPNIARFVLLTRQSGTITKSCTDARKTNEVKSQAPKRARYFLLNQELSQGGIQHFDFTETGFNSFTSLSRDLNSSPPDFLDKARFSHDGYGCLNTFPVALCQTDAGVLFKARISYMVHKEDSYKREIIAAELAKDFSAIILKKTSAKNQPLDTIVLKRQKTTSSAIFFSDDKQTVRAVLNFSDTDQEQPFNLFIQTSKLLIQFDW